MPPSKRKYNGSHERPPRPQSLKRSSRHIKGEASNEADAAALAVHPYQSNWQKSNHCDGLLTKEAVERAVRDLMEMDERFAAETRRQRLKVEASDPTKLELIVNGNQGPPTDGSPAVKEDVYSIDNGTENGNDAESAKRGDGRPHPVNSDKLPLPWTGRLGYPVFSSRTCRISSILEHRHPLQDPDKPEHPIKNRPDKNKPASIDRGRKFVENIGLANAKDIVKMIRWNDKYGINFMRLSSEMFPFASHSEYGYSLKFAADVLADAGRVASSLGHRLTTHPGQFTQIGSPRKEVVEASFRDLKYHAEMLSLLKLSEQLDRDAVMILHMGGVYGDKEATIARFKENYAKLPDGVKKRLVLENDDVSYSVHDLLPVCEELNIPLVLDFHHHNIIFDPCMREGTLDIVDLFPRILETWKKKNITPKMHYSEPRALAVTPRERRKHSARVKSLPPCPCDMDLMIEAKDKEQAVFELMRAYKLPGWQKFNDIIPHQRNDESKPAVFSMAKKAKGEKQEPRLISSERVLHPDDESMGGPERRVYWPEGMEDWLRPEKRKAKTDESTKAEDADSES